MEGALNLNEVAHGAARALTERALLSDPPENRDTPSTYHEIPKHYRLLRRSYSARHHCLNWAPAVSLRMLQIHALHKTDFTNTYLSFTTDLTAIAVCYSPLNVFYLLWGCSRAHPNHEEETSNFDQAIRIKPLELRSQLAPQLWAVQRAHTAAAELWLPVPSWEKPTS